MAPMPVPMSPQQQQEQQQQGMMATSPMAMAASPVSIASSGSSNSAGTAPSLGAPAAAADPFASFGVPQVSPQPQAAQPQAQESPTALVQGQPPAMDLRQPFLGTAEMQPGPAPVQAPAPDSKLWTT